MPESDFDCAVDLHEQQHVLLDQFKALAYRDPGATVDGLFVSLQRELEITQFIAADLYDYDLVRKTAVNDSEYEELSIVQREELSKLAAIHYRYVGLLGQMVIAYENARRDGLNPSKSALDAYFREAQTFGFDVFGPLTSELLPTKLREFALTQMTAWDSANATKDSKRYRAKNAGWHDGQTEDNLIEYKASILLAWQERVNGDIATADSKSLHSSITSAIRAATKSWSAVQHERAWPLDSETGTQMDMPDQRAVPEQITVDAGELKRLMSGEADHPALAAILSKMPEQRRKVLILDAQGLTYSEIAVELNIKSSTVKTHLQLARKDVESMLQ